MRRSILRASNLRGIQPKLIELFANHFSGKGGNQSTEKAMQEVLEKAPNHLSARLLLSSMSGNIPDQLSLRGSLKALNQITATILEATETDLSATSALESGKWVKFHPS